MDNKSSAETDCTVSTTSSTTTTSSGNNNRDMYLKHLNKISHKISKPIRKPPLFDNQNAHAPPVQTHAPPAPPPQQQQPPVYNINKSDFRDVVQKLTGSPAHERINNPPPPPSFKGQHGAQSIKAQSSRLQRIRPPPLAQIGTRPPPPFVHVVGGSSAEVVPVVQSQPQPPPLSPLPPFPAVHAAAESPISAYMRFLQNSIASGSSGFSPLAPWWGPPQQQPPFPLPQTQQPNFPPPPTASSSGFPSFPSFPSSPLPFGCLPSPKSPYGLLSPSGLGFQQLPLSPTLPVPSPTWKGI